MVKEQVSRLEGIVVIALLICLRRVKSDIESLNSNISPFSILNSLQLQSPPPVRLDSTYAQSRKFLVWWTGDVELLTS